MNAGKKCRIGGQLRAAVVAIFLLAAAAGTHAIDNPDAPNRPAAFERRAMPFEAQLAATDGGSAATRAGQAYAAFLDTELNIAYIALLAKLTGPARRALVESQRRWLSFRASEDRFIVQHWTPERMASSASLSVAGYRNALVKERVLQLLRYTAEY